MAIELGMAGARNQARRRGRRVDSGTAWRVGVLVLAGVVAVAKACSTAPLPQPRAYFDFVDHRTIAGVMNAQDVLSNAAFAVAGVAGLVGLARRRIALRDARERWPWAVFFAGVALTSVGSAWFHLDPSNDSLVWDRLPMAVGFVGLLAALVAERIDVRAGLGLLGPLVAAGVGSVAYWIVTEHAGHGDLRPYLLVQFYPLACIVLVLALFPATYTGGAGWLAGLALYAGAKWAEFADRPVFAATGGALSGHTLKHLLAAAGIAVLLGMLWRRRPLSAGTPGSRAEDRP